jgi:Kef-type K+ transport system membrane component KefB
VLNLSDVLLREIDSYHDRQRTQKTASGSQYNSGFEGYASFLEDCAIKARFMAIGGILTFVGAFFVIAPIAAKLISLIIKRFDAVSEIPGLLPTTIVSLVLFFAWLAHALGAPELLGGFAAGLALSRRFFLPLGIALHADEGFAHRIEEQMRPIVHLFTPIFFVFVGLSLNLREIDWGSSFIWGFSLSLLGVAIIAKLVGAFLN